MMKNKWWLIPIAVSTATVVMCLNDVSAKDNRKRAPLTAKEAQVILHKGTERPFSGKYWNHKKLGTYRCRQCGTPLYRSTDKFDSGCGWPAFDSSIGTAVKEVPDRDGVRQEIICRQCSGHLGHVFHGEGFTKKNVRHCVNSISLEFEPAQQRERAIFAGGCFWGVEHWLEKQPGVVDARSGYTGGSSRRPGYRSVASGKSNHVEAVEVVFDPTETSFETLARLFFEIHDPTQVDRQGPDIGRQYRSAIFYTSNEQRAVARKLVEQLERRGFAVATKILPAGQFWPAEKYHQNYYDKKDSAPYCHVYQKRF